MDDADGGQGRHRARVLVIGAGSVGFQALRLLERRLPAGSVDLVVVDPSDHFLHTVSEIFPLEVRAKAIAVFFAIAQCFGALGPVIYGALIGDGSDPRQLFYGYLLGAAVMVVGGVVAIVFGVDAERRSLEDVATPLSARP